MPAADRRRPPAFLMGLVNLPFGLTGGLSLVTAPQLLAARHVPEPAIASITAAALIPTFAVFALGPIVDVRFSRRTYAWALGILTALLAVATLASLDDLARFTVLLVATQGAVSLYNVAIGGWLGDVVRPGDEGRLAAGFQSGNGAGFGIGAALFLPLLRWAPGGGGAVLAAAVIAAPLVLLLVIPASRRDRLGLHESFAALGRDLGALAQRPVVRRALLLFVPPTCAFAMSNTLTGVGGEFAASEQFVSVAAGPATAVIGVIASIAGASLVRRFVPGRAFLVTGAVGAAFTASFLLLPRTPWVLALGISGENGLQSVAFAIASAIIFRSIGDDNPLAATQYGLLNSAVALPTTYMQWVDGRAYAAGGGLQAGLACDAALALAGAMLLWPVLSRWRQAGERAF